MIKTSFSLLLLASLAAPLLVSFGAEEKKPARKKRPPPVVSPTIHEDGKVTFRVQTSNATEVSVSGEMAKGRQVMVKEEGDRGIWSVTLDPVEPGLYGYSFSIDGVKQLDPGNRHLKPGRSPRTSILYLPGDHSFDFRKGIPHGTVHYHGYHSKPIDRFREMKVYTPPGYETSEASYPLLVLQHGHSDSYATWTDYGKAHWILDNLIADGKAVPMIVVMLDGHPIPESYGNGRSPENAEELRRDLVEAALPMVENRYRVKPGREHRAIAGLSMGGLHALTIGLNELDTFAWIGGFSSAVPATEEVEAALADGEKTSEQLELLWIACGKDDFLLGENQTFIAALEEAKVEHEWLLTEGAHSWPIWRGYLADFVPLLFR